MTYGLCRKMLLTKALVALAVLGLLAASIADAETKRKRTYDWDTGQTCYESCWTDMFGNENCTIRCY